MQKKRNEIHTQTILLMANEKNTIILNNKCKGDSKYLVEGGGVGRCFIFFYST